MAMPRRYVLALRTLFTTALFVLLMAVLGGLAFHLYLAEAPIPPNDSPVAVRTGPASTQQLVVVVVDGLREDVAKKCNPLSETENIH